MDRTPEYHAIMTESEYDDTLKEFETRLKGHTILFVRGFLGDPMRPAYFVEQLRYFSGLEGVTVEVANIDGEQAPVVNAPEIRDAIARVPTNRRVILFTHSKGSLDALHMLLGQPDLCGRIATWISVQGALLGSPVADVMVTNPHLRAVAKHVLEEKLGGSVTALESLQTTRSGDLIRDRSADIQALCSSDMRILCYGSAISGWTPLSFFRDFMLQSDLQNDGLMPIENTFLPGADVIRNLAGPDHAAPVMAFGAPACFDRARFSRALIRMGLG